MNCGSLTEHSHFVEAKVPTLCATCSFAFGASICQRLLPLLIDELGMNKLHDVDRLERMWESVWGMLADLNDRPEDLVEFFEKLVPNPNVSRIRQEYFQCSNILYGFVSSMEGGSPTQMLYISDASLALLDNFLHRTLHLQPSSLADQTIFGHHLVQSEIQRQKRDLEEVRQGAAKDAVIRLWQRSRLECLFDE
jgi:hypothetical protein